MAGPPSPENPTGAPLPAIVMTVPEATGAWAHSGMSRTEEAAQREGHEYENDGPHWIWLRASAVSGVDLALGR